ncbi:hypothetical protein K402DRAFT_409864 [Aulographum hederae CBS 113979]|uniref:SIN1-domain-containing protein n=1 Tax=Aulographum hederae CBS 113979 TaxID=1176131 RepID=A0A6G1HCK8_9PEZI|nr:hypothetical protein K402DRAFT_409864 [Aulographum hederae CBS 113979]
MSLLQDEEFVLYQLRTAYLTHIHDGVGERLINVNTSVLNNPAFRAAGWVPNAADIRRTYSPPIPTAVTSEYFQVPRHNGSRPDFGDDEEEGGMVTGGASNDTVGPAMNARRRRRKELLEEDDSSDLSDDSDEDPDPTQRAAQLIKFSKMPLRNRAGSSPVRESNVADGPEVMVTSPSKPRDPNRPRRGSLVEAVKARERRDTTTSSERSSENELDPSVFKRKQINPSRAAKASQLLADRIQEDEREASQMDDDDPTGDSDNSISSSEFIGTADSGSILDVSTTDDLSSPFKTRLPNITTTSTPRNNSSPRKTKQAPSVLQALPPPRPISVIGPPVSLLTMALKSKNSKPDNPVGRFATLSGKGDPNPLYIKIYAPFSDWSKPYELLLKRTTHDGNPVTVADAIGLALWRYGEETFKPAITGERLNVNRWTLRMIEDEEVDYDFPALSRVGKMTDFTSNNNRGARARSRDKPWDEFALVEAKDAEFDSNEKITPDHSSEAPVTVEDPSTAETNLPVASRAQTPAPSQGPTPTPSMLPFRNPITGPSFAPSGPRKDSSNLLDARAPVSHATPRTGAPKSLAIRFTNEDFVVRTTTIEVTTDTYIAEVFDQACRKFGAEKALYVLKVSGTNTVAPSDRTVEALGVHSHLDLGRRRFATDGFVGIAGSPGSSSPNAPLLIEPGGTPKKGKKGAISGSLGHPLAHSRNHDALLTVNSGAYKRWNVVRKQPMSFSSSSARTLSVDGEYMYIMPLEGGAGKIITVHFSSVVGAKVSRKHPKTFRVEVYKDKEQNKRYDFDAQSHAEAQEVVREIRAGADRFDGSGAL